MKGLYKHILLAFAVMAAMLLHSSCVEHMEEDFLAETEYVSFRATLDGGLKSYTTKGHLGSLDFEEEDWVLSSETSTKASLLSSLDKLTAGVVAYVYDGIWTPDNSPLSLINNHSYTFDGDQLDAASPVRWSQVEEFGADGHNFRVFVYAPRDKAALTYEAPKTDDSEAKGAPVIKIPDILAKGSNGEFLYQNDIIVADNVVTMDYEDKNHRKEVALDFEHIYTAIQFKAGFDCTIKSVTITGIKTGGDYVIGSKWNLQDATHTYSMNIPDDGLQVTAGADIGDLILMLPQEISADDAKITLEYSDNNGDDVISAILAGVEWKQGKRVNYTLKRESDRKYIYLDLAAGNIEVTSKDGKTYYNGKVFKKTSADVKPQATTKDGYIEQGQELYVYQSCVTPNNDKPNIKTGQNNYMVGYEGDNVFTLPVYPPVMYKGQLWSDFITNNTYVDGDDEIDGKKGVIQAWDNEAGAGKATQEYINSALVNGSGADGAVRDAGREATKYRIHITGNIGDVKLNIDNIYSSYQERGSTPVRKRTKGGISFLPAQDGSHSVLTINIIGDNRLGCVNYQNWKYPEKNCLVFEGSGSLTVGDTDYYRDGSGLGSNRSCSVIGGKDETSSEEDVYNIVFNSGVIYAGATPSSCTAIGGGGNGDTNIIINGGTITAVAKSTGTAIGGGTGLVQPGGEGNVTIKNGNVYAYNFANTSKVPAAAIGAAGSQSAVGGKSNVTIEGGYVYAYSEYGTAIGGGSSAYRHGGKGEINISGGTVIAKTGDENSVGIGGGSSYTEKYDRKNQETNNGGDATVTITGNPIIRTGSIGGGTPGKGEDHGGKIGSAEINVSGGDIQAQFVMADSQQNTFNMSGGVIRNSATSDQEYYCIQENGGAVYMEKGTFTMSGGTIKECYANKNPGSKGGAVYLKGDSETSFKMTGGEIRECRANAHGGAVYLEGGIVTIKGGRIYGNVAYNGNGGAISIWGGSFLMDDASAVITQNAAFNSGTEVNGNGGGIYISPASSTSTDSVAVTLNKGSITGNSSDRNGGGVCVDMGSNNVAKLNVIVGEVSDGNATDALKVNENNAQIKGGGMYVNGTNASVTLNDGYILENETSSYRVNPDITVEGGLVTLMKSGITTYVTVTFSNNAQYYTKGKEDDIPKVQYVVAASNSKLNINEFPQINDYYNTFVRWDTRRDGKGNSYADGGLYSFNEDITLYAQWE